MYWGGTRSAYRCAVYLQSQVLSCSAWAPVCASIFIATAGRGVLVTGSDDRITCHEELGNPQPHCQDPYVI